MTTSIYPDYETLSQRTAEHIRSVVQTVLATQATFALALSGGSTPTRVYEHLSEMALPWNQIHLFWGDERFVPHSHEKSNVALVRETLLDHVDVPDENVHPMPTSGRPREAAATYADTLHSTFADRPHTFDLALLGMGKDGHTASLFPEHNPQVHDPKWVRAVSAPPRHSITQRLTCTLPVLNNAQQVFILVSGASKRETVRAARDERDNSLPITRVDPKGEKVWLLDADAAPHVTDR